MKREILINAGARETRVAILEDEKLVELLVDRPDNRRMVGDVYLGKVDAVLPGIQAAFIDIGMEKSAFLHASDLVRENAEEAEDDDDDGKPCVDDRAVADRMLRDPPFRHGPAQASLRSSPTSDSTAATREPSRIAEATVSISAAIERSSSSRGDSERTNSRVARTPTPGSSGARNSTPWAPASSSIASARSPFASTCHALSPAAFPIET